MAAVILLEDALLQLKKRKRQNNHSELCSGFTARTFRLTDAAATQFCTLSPTPT